MASTSIATTVRVPQGSTIYAISATNTPYTPWPTAIPPGADGNVVLAPNSGLQSLTLYFPLALPVPTGTIDLSSLASKITSSVSGASMTSAVTAYALLKNTQIQDISVTTTLLTFGIESISNTVFIPYIASIPTSLDGSEIFMRLSSSPLYTSSSSNTGAVISTVTGGSSSASHTTSPTSTHPAPTKSSSPITQGTLTGAVIGGTVGGFLAGLLACVLIVFFCLRRRRSRSAGYKKSQPSEDSKTAELKTFIAPSAVTGWQKHLPQEKDDRTIVQKIKSIFEQVQIHTEGFYGNRSRDWSSDALISLEKLSIDGLSELLVKSSEPLPLIEAIIIHWIIHRISLRSEPGESLLPMEYTSISAKNKWYMESDKFGDIPAVESKRGFSQAFSQWRVLTSFLRPDPRTEHGFNRDLATKIERAARTFTEAFAPFELSGKNQSNRLESLRKIMQQASDAGIMLFAQPSTYIFDWSSEGEEREQTVVIAPAFARRLDASGEVIRSMQVLIPARRVGAQYF